MSDHLAAGYDLVIFDLDGVVFLIDKPIPGAAEAVDRLRSGGTPIAYATNNASRRAADVATLLTGMGVSATPAEVLTSAGAAAALLAERFPAGAPVLVVGAEALRAEVRDAGLTPVGSAEDEPVAVVQGYGPEVGWKVLSEAALAVRAGAAWFATNTDRTLPSPRGPLPGNGSLVAVLRTALDREPDVVVGKPQPGLFTTAATLSRADRPLAVGDRLDTDIQGAVGAGMDSLLVLTGVSGPADLLAAPAERRPAFVAADLSGLFRPADEARVPATGGEAGGWRVSRDGDRAVLDGSGDPVDALRLLCGVTWDGVPVAAVEAGSPAAGELLRDWGV
ncbi:putative haloacid dehalogenase-like hydrolase [Actinoplanes missouriensis 431]|uniref:Putative haloacid dehalogenase-like hydrolase n=1 Tax=Actinoplanes missouriensis (strain ATCC 14538 / DSM 43046 / CBS 188.64 / JCM 3121 / NBRC 102363 / NCIMB 12654 / NRRL B-3342 / UNCC 431) TaxID=512565 RepID=I0HE87_ACTM4|nr:HAD-IIA family hydrolase [Actinoplanes missouriensis]BAL91324.1 putative haloacid dehalogenase-like hydrolase [Actinoplanes missouriensis 431]